MISQSGFIHPVVKDNQGEFFTLLGVSNFKEINDVPAVVVQNADGVILSVSQDALKKNYSMARRLAIHSSKSDRLKEISILAPVMTHYTGVKYIMVGVVEAGTEKLALYQSIEGGETFSMPLGEFYDLFSINHDIAFSAKPTEVDDQGGIGYVTSQVVGDVVEFQSFIIRYEQSTGRLLI
jgi:hypothetical protein